MKNRKIIEKNREKSMKILRQKKCQKNSEKISQKNRRKKVEKSEKIDEKS